MGFAVYWLLMTAYIFIVCLATAYGGNDGRPLELDQWYTLVGVSGLAAVIGFCIFGLPSLLGWFTQ